MDDPTCTRCGRTVPPILGGPPPDRDVWWRYQIRITTRSHVLTWRRFTRRWLPEDPADQVTEAYTTLDLCDDCAGEVFMFAQDKYEGPPKGTPGGTETGVTIVHAASHIRGRTCRRQPDGTWKPIRWEDGKPVEPGESCIATHDLPEEQR